MSISFRNPESGLLEQAAGFNDVDNILTPTSKNPPTTKAVYDALAQKVEKTVNDLVNYYTTSQTYNKAEVRELIGAINTLTIEVVATLPTTEISSTTIYFVGPAAGTNNYDEYVYVNATWVKIGDTEINLSDYITTSALNTALQNYYTKAATDNLLTSYYTKTQVDNLLNAKEDTLTFDNTPTAGSSNPVSSSGIKTALDTKQDTLQWDTVPTASSTKSINSGNLKTAFDTKQNEQLANPVTVGSNTYETVNAALTGIGSMLNSGMSLGLTLTTLPMNANMNDYYDSTFKLWGNSGTNVCSSIVNGPSGRQNGEMAVIYIPFGSATYGAQLYFAGAIGQTPQIYMRYRGGNNGWTSWVKLH